MSEKVQIRAGAIFSILCIALFGAIAGQAVYSLFGLAALIAVVVVIGFVIWRVWVEAENIIEYRNKLYWEGVEFVNPTLMSQNPRNVGDAHEVIKVLKQRILDLDDARSEAVARYNELKAEQDQSKSEDA